MKQGYFIYNGAQYPTGTVIRFKDFFKEKIRLASFIYYDTEKKMYVIRYEDDGKRWYILEKEFIFHIQGITDKFAPDVKIPEEKQLPDSKIEGMTIGWVWYITIMLIMTIFNGRILGWILVSIYFFSVRKKKIKKEGNYIEW